MAAARKTRAAYHTGKPVPVEGCTRPYGDRPPKRRVHGLNWPADPLLTTVESPVKHGVPSFGANGIEFNQAGTVMYVANTGDDRILQIAVNGNAGAVTVFTNSINGEDGKPRPEQDHAGWGFCLPLSPRYLVLNCATWLLTSVPVPSPWPESTTK
jgi:sugar lactone lactonase YvrE